jgi:hypothetical protein
MNKCSDELAKKFAIDMVSSIKSRKPYGDLTDNRIITSHLNHLIDSGYNYWECLTPREFADVSDLSVIENLKI